MGENIRKTEICNNCTPLIIERILKQENNGVPAFKKILNLLSVMSVLLMIIYLNIPLKR